MLGSNYNHDRLDLAEHRAADIAAQFPDSLSSSEMDQVTHRVQRLLRSIETMRQHPLDNGDEPAPVFRAIGKEKP